MIPTTTQNYIEILEKTNAQLSLWYNPYGLMIGILTLLVAVLAIYFAYILYRQGRDYQDFLEKQKNILGEETRGHAKKVLDEYIQSRNKELEGSTGEVKEKIEKELENLKKARESLNLFSTVQSIPIPGTYEFPITSAMLNQPLRSARDQLTEPQVESIIALLQSFGAEAPTIYEVEKALRR